MSRGEIDPWLVQSTHHRDFPTGEESGCWVTKLVNTHHEVGWRQEGSGRGLKDAPERPLPLRTPPSTVSKWRRHGPSSYESLPGMPSHPLSWLKPVHLSRAGTNTAPWSLSETPDSCFCSQWKQHSLCTDMVMCPLNHDHFPPGPRARMPFSSPFASK